MNVPVCTQGRCTRPCEFDIRLNRYIVRCRDCRQSAIKSYMKIQTTRQTAGLCLLCREPRINKQHCELHSEMRRKSRRQCILNRKV